MSLSDLWHYWGSDLTTDNTGDLALADGVTYGQQRILRRLLTNPGDYLFHPEYGAGLPRYVGQAIDVGKISALIRGQMLLEDSVEQSPPPVVTVTQSASDLTAFNVSINYNDATTQSPAVLSFTVSK